MIRDRGLLQDHSGRIGQNIQRLVREEFNSIGSRYLRVVTADRNDPEADLSWLPALAHSRVLDVACGPGTYSTALSRQARSVVGVDLAEGMLQWARQPGAGTLAGNLEFVQGDAAQLPFTSGAFDVCFCAFSFAHFPNPKQVLKEMTRALRPDGILALVDVVAPEDRRQSALLNRLEMFRERCYTRIRAAGDFMRLLTTLPLRCDECRTETHSVSFRRWISASHLRPGSLSFWRARRLFYETAKEQLNTGSSNTLEKRRQYSYIVARFLLRKDT